MHVDGFRFDLASALARELHEVDRLGAFFDIMHQDPVLSQVKLIAEPWDLGEGGYQVGNFPAGWTEWNDKYRDAMRAYWKGDGGLIGELARRLTGSSDLYGHSGRRPYASINFVTAHDGFTLPTWSLQREAQRGERRGQPRRPRPQPVVELRRRGPDRRPGDPRPARAPKRNLLATLLLSQGVPMLLARRRARPHPARQQQRLLPGQRAVLAGLGRRCVEQALAEFVRKLIALRREHPVFRRRNFFQGRPLRGSEVKDIVWLKPDGTEMTDEEWDEHFARCLGVYLSGEALTETDRRGRRLATTTSWCCSTRTTSRSRSGCRRSAATLARAARYRHRRGFARRRRSSRVTHTRCRAARWRAPAAAGVSR